jgi:hypothetical protein
MEPTKLKHQNVVLSDLRSAKLWACVHKNGYVSCDTLSYTRIQSIKNYMNGINPKLNWRYFKRRGVKCMKVRVDFKCV